MTETGRPDGARCPVFDLKRMDEVVAALRSPDIINSPIPFAGVLRDPEIGEVNIREFLNGTVVFLQGQEHRARRRLLNQLVRQDSLAHIREDLVLPEVDRLMSERLTVPDADNQYGFDLVDFCERVFLRFAVDLLGLVNVDSDEAIDRLRRYAGPIAAGTSSNVLANREEISRRALEAKRQYVEEFYIPSRDAYRGMMNEVAAGSRTEESVPPSIMKFIVTAADPAYADESQAIIETTMMMAASVGTSTNSIVHTVEYLQHWFADHPEDDESRADVAFLQDALAETIRLRAPFSPYVYRQAAAEHRVGDRVIAEGQEVHAHLVYANRSKEVFGQDADEFNPRRPAPSNGLPRFGVGFGAGIHQCYGLRVVLGNEGVGGAHVHLLKALMDAGVRRDPRSAPNALGKDMSHYEIEDIPRYTTYPVVFPNWDPARQPKGVRS